MANWISVDEVANEYGVSSRTVRRWLKDGRITGRRVGPTLWRFDADQVRAELVGA